jgi:hypothetical protein
MCPHRRTFDPKGPMSRKRTADLLKTLRKAKSQAGTLKARIESAEQREHRKASSRKK